MAQEKWLIDGPKVIDIDSARKLKVSLVGGQVNIIGHDEPGVRVEVQSVSGKPLLVSLDNGTLLVDHPQVRWDNFIDAFRSFKGSAKADVSIRVPRDVALTFGAVSSSALISGLGEDASISTVNGDLVVDGLTGSLQLNSVNGEISVRDHTGRVSAHSVSGDVTVNGDVSTLSADAVSGDVFLDLTGTPDEVRVNTVNGTVTLRLEDGVAAQYKINTVGGRIQLDGSEVRGVRGAYTGSFGALDKRWVQFKARTVSGSITAIHRVNA